MRNRIQRVSPERLQEVIEQYAPRGRFLAKEDSKWVAVDNSTGDAWTEEFSRKHQAIRWLRGEFEVGDMAEQWVRIIKADELVEVAMQQGVKLDVTEADMILGYLEGHEYSLMADSEGVTVRHDEQYRDNHRGDEPYTVQDAIVFCQEMNEDLLNDNSSQSKPDMEYLSQLKKDEQVLHSLMARLSGYPVSIGEV